MRPDSSPTARNAALDRAIKRAEAMGLTVDVKERLVTFKPTATVFQHGDRLLVASTSFAAGRRANGWFEDLTTGSSDAELTAALEAALGRSRPEDFKDLPQPSSPESTLASDRLGFVSDSAMARATTTVGDPHRKRTGGTDLQDRGRARLRCRGQVGSSE